VEELKDPFELKQVAQMMLAPIAEFGPLGQCTAGQLLDGLGQGDLPAVRGGKQPGQPIEGAVR
jgi:hypothetical protein